jgi:hypothetical protein
LTEWIGNFALTTSISVKSLEGWRKHSVAAFLSAYRPSLSDTRLWPQTVSQPEEL